MALIHKIVVDDRALLIAPRRKVFANFFGIDSCHILLGRNGAGKTTLLTRIAEMVAQPRGDSEILLAREDGHEARWMTADERRRHGAVFFTALPYRRALPKTRVVDASLRERDRGTIGDIDIFRHVCRELDVHTSLRASISFSQTLFSEVLLPAVVQGRQRGYRFKDPHLDDIAEKLLVALSDAPQAFTVEDSAESDKGRRKAKQELIHILKSQLSAAEYISRGRTIELAVLQKLAARTRDKVELGLNFLIWTNTLDGPATDRRHERYLATFRDMIDETYRHVDSLAEIEDDRDGIYFVIPSNEEASVLERSTTAIQVAWDQLSSGMQALIDQFSRIRGGIEQLHQRGIRNILLLIDEGDAYLHLDWQRRYVELLDRFLTGMKRDFDLATLQVILTTHSPVIATDFPSAMVTNLDDDVTPRRTFAAPLDDIALTSFGTQTLGSFAAQKIDALHANLRDGNATEADAALLEEIGDLTIQNALRRVAKGSQS
ncbi:AAA family ATPase [Cupriavidus sp. P-10]|uniref:AAA family ATPase n=1 Tax=Cupriavidus sp. P-10 TaxID=2027911 RepID=UPI000E2E88BB|nr:AAA family ATPase [Cupriavidus sp. P-10]BDB27302.1 AAA family ATPase [Cupriavidus sp. P-10]